MFLLTNISIGISNDTVALNRWKERHNKFIYTHRIFNTYIWNLSSITRIHKCIPTDDECILFYEQYAFKNSKKIFFNFLMGKSFRLYFLMLRWDKSLFCFMNRDKKKRHIFSQNTGTRKDTFILMWPWCPKTLLKIQGKSIIYCLPISIYKVDTDIIDLTDLITGLKLGLASSLFMY